MITNPLSIYPRALHLSGNADSTKTVVLRGEGSQGPVAEVNPTSLSFPNVRVDSERTERITLRNSGGDTLKVRDWAGLQAPFSVVNTQLLSLVAGETREVSVRFAPVAKGIFTDTLQIVSNAETRLVPVTGRGTRAEFTVTPSPPILLVFDPVPAGGTSGDLPLLISNSGDDTLVVTSIVSSKPQRFQVGVSSLVVPPNKAEQVSVRFTPGTAEQDSADISIVTNVGTKQVRAAGSIGRPPEVVIGLSPESFGNISVGKKSPLMQVTLTNRSSTSVTVEGLDLIPLDAPVRKGATSSFPLVLLRDQSLQVTNLEFTPTTVGPLSATLRARVAGGIESNKSLLGNGVEGAKVEFDQDTLRVLNVALTTASTGTVLLRNEGGDTLRVERVRVSPTVFTLTPIPGELLSNVVDVG